MTKTNPSKEQIQEVLDEVDAMDLPDGAHWMMCHEKLGLDYGDLFPLMEEYDMFDEGPDESVTDSADAGQSGGG